MRTDLTGVRERKGKKGSVYQVNVSVNGVRRIKTYKNLEEALKARNDMRVELKTETAKQKPTNHMLITAFNLTVKTCWEGTKSAETAMLNGRSAIKFFGERFHLDQLTTERVREYVEYLESRGNTGGTVNRKLSALSMILKTAEEHSMISHMPVLRRRKEYRGRDRFVTEEEEKQMLHFLRLWTLEDYADAVITLIDTGFRCGEMLKLEKQDVDFVRGKYGLLTVWRTKTDRPRGVPMTERVRDIMKRRVNQGDDPRVFPYTKSWIRNTWNRLKARMDLDDDVQFVPHILRHTCASRLVQNGVPLSAVKEWMGHGTIQSTMRYAHLAPAELFKFV